MEPLIIEGQGVAHRFSVEIADEARERAQGLMYRRSMAEDAGMLFLFEQPSEVAFWMKDTYIPLDMIFIGEDGRILAVAENVQPLQVETVSPGVPVIAVLELNGGTAARLGIRRGDKILHRAFGTLAE